MKRHFRWLCASLLLLACHRGAAPDGEIRIGAFLSLTGNTATFGRSGANGMKLAAEEVNTAGGVLSRQIRLIIEDDRSQPEEAKLAVTKLIKQDHVVALLGELTTTRTLAAAPEAQQQHIPMLSPSATNPQVTAVGDFIFRGCFLDSFQGAAMGQFVRQSLKLDRVGILKDTRNDYSLGLADFFGKTFTRLGGTIVAEAAYSEGDTEFRPQLIALMAKDPQAIYIPGYYTEVGLIARQARELGIHLPLLGGDGWDSRKTLEIGGTTLEGSYFSNHYAVDDPNPTLQAFVRKYEARFGQKPDGTAALAYDAALVLFDAIRRAGTIDSVKIRDALASTTEFPGVVGAISIDRQRNVRKPLVIMKIAHGEFVFDSRVVTDTPDTAAR